MKKIATLIVTLALLLPFTATLPTPVAAAKTKTYKFSIINANFLNAKQTFHTAKSSVTVYKAAFGADNPSMDLTANGKLKPASTYYVTKIIKAKSDTTRKNQTFSYVQGHGWVQQAKLVRGVFD
ncbi:signal peptide protein, YSIRK family [Lentilactobacillus diolivorans]|uniref:signal peptide protein, YSIRK family n=1 Tax=Lentilactobacillus diolivorans TaxID=179838 RepID=UPI0024694D7D|nr:signal peptide protein, YSIRK family [Lentilactobacillus diolivorans]MDH5107102.1 signal peptide protein, YSIRK family [Lentilactobacillus diolivorans]